MIDGYEAFGLYESLKLHFTKDSYDFHKYNGKSNISVTSFENRKDKYHVNSQPDLFSYIKMQNPGIFMSPHSMWKKRKGNSLK